MGDLVVKDDADYRGNMVSQSQQVMRLVEIALNSNADIEKLDKLLDLQRKFDAEQARKAYFAAMANFQADCPIVHKTGMASFNSKSAGGGKVEYTYASIDAIVSTIKESLSKSGLSYRFEQRFEGSTIWVTCILTHYDGHSESCEMFGFADTTGSKNAIQQIASTISYLRRYTLTGVTGVVTSDDDNDAAGAPEPQQVQEQQPALSYYPSDRFDAAFPKWKVAIESGAKTKASVIATVESKFPLTEKQKAKINSIKEPQK